MPSWPGELPQDFIASSYNEAMPENVIRDQFDTGPAGVRRRTTSAPFPVGGSMLFTIEQWETLAEFYIDELKSGALPFDFPRQGYQSGGEWLVRFMKPPTRRAVSNELFEIAITLEVLP